MQLIQQKVSTIALGSDASIPASRETFFCNICLENQDIQIAQQLTLCQHYFCKGCLSNLVSNAISNHRLKIACCHTADRVRCTTILTESDIMTALNQLDESTRDKLKRKYERFANSEIAVCPFCDSNVLRSNNSNEITCTNCSKPFCFIHGNAHDEKTTCEVFDQQETKTSQHSISTLNKHSKPCPNCKSTIWKSGGCNHMTCTICETHWCWLCSTIMKPDEITMHYLTSNCKGRQFASATTDMSGLRTIVRQQLKWYWVIPFYLLSFLTEFVLVVYGLFTRAVSIMLGAVVTVPCYAILHCRREYPEWAIDNGESGSLLRRLSFRKCYDRVKLWIVIGLIGVFTVVMFPIYSWACCCAFEALYLQRQERLAQVEFDGGADEEV